MKSFPAKNQGFTLLEILLVIGIAAVIAIAAFMAWPAVQSSQRANAEQSRAMTIAAGVKQAYNGRYSGVSNENVIRAKIPPSDMINGTALNSSWGGTVTVAPAATNTKFTITYDTVPENVCLKLAPGLGQSFENVTVGGTAIRDDAAGTAYNPAAVITQCSDENFNGNIVITTN